MDDKIPKAFDYYKSDLYTLDEIGKMLEIKAGSVMYLVKLDPRYADYKASRSKAAE